jgi:Tfp pilus assembly protein PilF
LVLPIKDFTARPRSILEGGAAGSVSTDALLGLTKTIEQDRRGADKGSPKSQAKQQKAVRLLKTGLKALSRKEYATASTKIEQALELDKGMVLAWRMLAFAFEQQGEFSKAFTAYEAVARLEPDDVTLLRKVGQLAYRLGKLDLAEKLFERFLASDPGDEEVTNSLAVVLRDQNRYGDAIELLRGVIGRYPERPRLWNTLGTVLSESGDAAGAVVFYDEALRLDPAFHLARHNRACFFTVLDDPEKAIEEMEIAAQGFTNPKDVAAGRLAKALTQFLVGDLVGGFESYEARFDESTGEATRFAGYGKRWEVDDDLHGKNLLIYGEQGLGDEVLFANVVNDTLDAIGPDGRLFLAVEPRLVSLFQRSFPRAVVLAYRALREFKTISMTVNLGDPHPQIDFWTPLGSLFRRFRTSLATFPKDSGYLVPDPQRVAHWRQVLEASGPGPYVGVLWKSLKMGGGRQRHYSPFELWSPILENPSLRFVNLQYGDAAEDLAAAKTRGLDIWTPPGINLMTDIDDLSALCSALDVVIGPSTATTNVAGAVGTRICIIAGPGWWTGFGSDHAPCYPSARVFRAGGFDQWGEVMQQIAKALDEEILPDRHGERVMA